MNFTLFSTFFQPASNATAAGGTSQTSHVPLSNVPPSAPPATTSTGSTPNPPVNQPANSAAPHTHAQPTGAQQLLNNPQASSGTQTNPNASQNSAQTGGSQQLPLPTVPNNATGNSASSTQASTAKTLHTRLHKLRSCTKFTSTWQNIGLLAGLALSIVFGFYGLKALKLAQWTANKDYLEFCGDYNKDHPGDPCQIPQPPSRPKNKRWFHLKDSYDGADAAIKVLTLLIGLCGTALIVRCLSWSRRSGKEKRGSRPSQQQHLYETISRNREITPPKKVVPRNLTTDRQTNLPKTNNVVASDALRTSALDDLLDATWTGGLRQRTLNPVNRRPSNWDQTPPSELTHAENDFKRASIPGLVKGLISSIWTGLQQMTQTPSNRRLSDWVPIPPGELRYMEKEFKEALILQLVNCALLRTICFQNRSKVRPTWRDITGSVSEDHGPTDNALAKAIWNQKTAWIDSRLPQSYELQNIIQRSLDDIANKLCPRRYWCGSDSASDFSCLAGMYIRGMAPEISLAVIDKLGITDSGTKEGDVLPNRHTLNCMSTSTTPLLNQQKKFTDWDLACLWSRSKEHFTVVDFDREAATADIVRQAQEMLENHLYDTRYF